LNITDKTIFKARVSTILKGLYFPEMSHRVEDIPDAHDVTFSWIFENPKGTDSEATNIDSRSPDASSENATRIRREAAEKFKAWLESPDERVFYIMGKPGCGKSTFLNYVSEQEQTKQLLAQSEWTGGKALVLASHFFWKQGQEIQRSILGFHRALLFQIFSRRPELISTVAREIWEDSAVVPASLINTSSWIGPEYRRSTVETMLDSLLQSPGIFEDIRLVFFLDGLDEFSPAGHAATYSDLVNELSKWTRYPHGGIKICI
jgi:hypothetical protein